MLNKKGRSTKQIRRVEERKLRRKENMNTEEQKYGKSRRLINKSTEEQECLPKMLKAKGPNVEYQQQKL